MLRQILSTRQLPQLLSRAEMLHILQKEQYRFVPKKPDAVIFSVEEKIISNFCTGKHYFAR